MFVKFNLKLSSSSEEILNSCSKTYSVSEKEVLGSIEKYALEDGSLNVSDIEQDWFPTVSAKVFLSHSHNDEKLVKELANFLYEKYGITSFIDSTVWGYADDLIRKLNNKYCVNITNESDLIRLKNKISSSVYILLQSALTKMIDHCECFVFVNTVNSLNESTESFIPSTHSIWLYNELLMASRIRRKSLETHRSDELSHGNIKYSIPVEMDGFVSLTIDDIEKAKEQSLFNDPDNILNTLYISKGIMNI